MQKKETNRNSDKIATKCSSPYYKYFLFPILAIMKTIKFFTATIPLIIFIAFAVFPTAKTFAQDSKEVVLGSRMEKAKGNSNVNIIKEEGIGVKMAAGRKPLQLKKLSLRLLDDHHPDTVSFYIRLFSLENGKPELNLFPDSVFIRPIINNELDADFSAFNIDIRGDFLIGLEWAATATGNKRMINIPTRLFNKGVYFKKKEESEWKKVPFFGFALQVFGERAK